MYSTFKLYLKQQAELGMPDYILEKKYFSFSSQAAALTLAKNRSEKKISTPTLHKKPEKENVVLPMPATLLHNKQFCVSPSVATVDVNVRDTLAKLFYSSRLCEKCPLYSTRKNFVFGSGNALASIMVVGEAPGQEEDESGLPFVGAAGQLLTKMLAAINLDRSKDVFITNIIKCRPPANRNPTPKEIDSCMPILQNQLAIIKPKAFLLLGRIAAQAMLCTQESISLLRQRRHLIGSAAAIVTYHPAALLRIPELKKAAFDDLKLFESVLIELGIYGCTKS